MKKKLLLMAPIALLSFFSCTKDKECTVTVKFTPEILQQVKGQTLYITDDTVKLDSVVIDSLNLSFSKITPKENSLNYVSLTFNGRSISYFVLEDGVVHIDFKDRQDSVYGTPMNDSIRSYIDKDMTLISDAYKMIDSLTKNDTTENCKSMNDSIMSKYENEYVDKSYTMYKSVFDNNKNNVLGLFALSNILSSDRLDVDKKLSLIDGADNLLKENHIIKETKDYLLKLKETSVGAKFKDFEGLNDSGDKVKLSDYVGKGKFVVVDFWASWCGPCRGEVPNLIKLYNEYKNKNVEVVGVAVSDKMEDHLKAVKDLNIPYPQIVNEQEARELYAIRGIPQIMLFSPDGTLIARDLRGQAIEEAVKSALDEK